MTDLPEPLTPADCDLTGMEWMPLFGHRLFHSNFGSKASDAEFRAALQLWWASWTQVPAASLPDDDVILCNLAGYGKDIKSWKKLRAGNVLHGFVKCSDGRLYHALLAKEAILAFERRLQAAKKREADRKRLQQWRDEQERKRQEAESGNGSNSSGETHDETRFTTSDETDRTRPDQTGPEKESKEERERGAAPPDLGLTPEPVPAPQAAPVPVAPSRSRSQGHRLPADWQPGQPERKFAIDLGLDPAEIAPQFCDHWHSASGAKASKTDWNAAWRFWCRNEIKMKPFASTRHGKPKLTPHQQAMVNAGLNPFEFSSTVIDQEGAPFAGLTLQ